MCVFRMEVEQLKAENAQLLLQLSQDKLDIADLNKRYIYLCTLSLTPLVTTPILVYYCCWLPSFFLSHGQQELHGANHDPSVVSVFDRHYFLSLIHYSGMSSSHRHLGRI